MTQRTPGTIGRTWRAALTAAVAAVLLLNVSVRGDDLVMERFGEYLEAYRNQAAIPAMAAAIVGANDILWERAFGRQDIERSIAARTDTPFQVDGVTQLFSAAMTLRCVEDGGLSLTDLAGQYRPNSPDRNATLGQLITHTSDTPAGLVFSYKPERLDPIWPAIRACKNGSFRKTLSGLFEQLAMNDSVPGADINQLAPPAEGIPSPEQANRYARSLARLAVGYSVDAQGRPTPAPYVSTTLTPGSGAISTVRDLARFDLALKNGVLVRLVTLAEAWQAPMGAGRQRLPHGQGWFVQSYNNVPVVWQFGVGDPGSSSLVVTLPAQKLTLVLLANSSGLVKPLPLAAGDLTVSPFGRLFLNVFAR
jgi:CubicO group peptidase (beta-lactamase class C family)